MRRAPIDRRSPTRRRGPSFAWHPRRSWSDAVHRTRPAITSRDIGAVVNRGLLAFAVAVLAFALFLFTPSSLQHGRSQAGLTRRFRAELATQQAPIGGAIPAGDARRAARDPGDRCARDRRRGYDERDRREPDPGISRPSVLPGQPGNSVIDRSEDRVRRAVPPAGLAAPRRRDPGHDRPGDLALLGRLRAPRRPSGNARPMLPTTKARLTLVTSDPVLLRQALPRRGREARERSVRGDRARVDDRARRSRAHRRPDRGRRRCSCGCCSRRWSAWARSSPSAASGARRHGCSSSPLVLAAAWLVFENVVVLLPASL